VEQSICSRDAITVADKYMVPEGSCPSTREIGICEQSKLAKADCSGCARRGLSGRTPDDRAR
jgi:hypothetical protein